MQNKKQKKQLELARKKRNDLQQRLAGARKQVDDPTEVKTLEAELAKVEAEIKKLQDE